MLLNNGDGTFGTAISYGGGGFGLVAFDADDDGDLDIAYSGDGTSLGMLFNDGDGTFSETSRLVYAKDEDGDDELDADGNPKTFTANVTYSIASSPRGRLVATDINGDGFIDLAMACYEANQIVVLPGQAETNGDIFGTAVSYALTSGANNYHPVAIVALDADGDGDIDLATVSDETEGGGLPSAFTVLLNQSR